MIGSIWTLFIPLYIAGFLVLLFGTFVLLSRIRGGKYIRPIVMALAKVPFVRRLMTKASRAALQRQNPELASALEKLERSGATRDPQRAQQAMSRLTASERQAWLDAAGDQGAMPTPSNRAERRRLEKLQKQRRR